jgi:hypothetical protein
VLTGRGLVWWALAAPVAMVSLQPGLRLADVRTAGLPKLRARTAREASAAEGRRSPLNAVIPTLLIVFAIALLPLWRPAGPAGVPVLILSYAPQGIAAELNDLVERNVLAEHTAVWNPQVWGSWLEFAVPELRWAVDSRLDVVPADVWEDADRLSSGSGDLEELLTNRVSAVVVASDQRALFAALDGSPDWQCLYEDDEGSIWLNVVGASPVASGCGGP